jgi:signal transduction histidine kinase
MTRFYFAIIAALISLSAFAPSAKASLIRDNLIASLSKLQTPADSIKRLYDIFDLSTVDQQMEVLEQLYATARRAGDDEAALGTIRLMANCSMKSIPQLDHLLSLAYTYPKSDDREETIVFLKLCKVKSIAHYGTYHDRIKLITGAIQEAKENESNDIYSTLENVASICILIGNNARGPLYDIYFERSAELIDSINSPSHALRNMFYAQMVITYDNLNEHQKTIDAARRLLDFTHQLEQEHHQKGRIYRNFNTVNYLTYRRMLGHSEALTPAEVEDIYANIKQLASVSPDVKEDFEDIPIATAYYHMARGEYNTALPYLLKAYKNNNDRLLKAKLLRCIIKTTQKTGDTATLAEYAVKYIDELENKLMTQETQEYREFEVLYDVSNLRRINSDLVSDKNNAEIEAHKSTLRIIIVGAILMLGLIIILFILLRRYRKQSASLAISNHDLTQERAMLLKTRDELIAARDQARKAERSKTDFINNISHEVTMPLDAIVEYSQLLVDCTESENRKYLARYADVIKLSTDLLRTLVNDVLDIGILENTDFSIKTAPASLQDICSVAIEAIRPRIKPGVKLNFTNITDELITTDARRVEQVLINMLSNAAKFTNQGSITFECKIKRSQNSVSFIVTDTGIGIPKGKELVIFDRFEKLDPHSQGSGLGLSICALIARLLNGKIYAEPNRKVGARFIFTIPLQQ